MNGTVTHHREMLMRNSALGQTAGGPESGETQTLQTH